MLILKPSVGMRSQINLTRPPTPIQRHCSAHRDRAPALLGHCPTAPPTAWSLDQRGPSYTKYTEVQDTEALDVVLKAEASSCLTLRCLARALSGYKTGSPPWSPCQAWSRAPLLASSHNGSWAGSGGWSRDAASAPRRRPACILMSHEPGGVESNTMAETCTHHQIVLL